MTETKPVTETEPEIHRDRDTEIHRDRDTEIHRHRYKTIDKTRDRDRDKNSNRVIYLVEDETSSLEICLQHSNFPDLNQNNIFPLLLKKTIKLEYNRIKIARIQYS